MCPPATSSVARAYRDAWPSFAPRSIRRHRPILLTASQWRLRLGAAHRGALSAISRAAGSAGIMLPPGSWTSRRSCLARSLFGAVSAGVAPGAMIRHRLGASRSARCRQAPASGTDQRDVRPQPGFRLTERIAAPSCRAASPAPRRLFLSACRLTSTLAHAGVPPSRLLLPQRLDKRAGRHLRGVLLVVNYVKPSPTCPGRSTRHLAHPMFAPRALVIWWGCGCPACLRSRVYRSYTLPVSDRRKLI